MKVGTVLHLEAIDPKTMNKEKYRCKVIDTSENYIYIDFPVHIKTQRTTFLPKRSRLTITFLDKNQNVFQFKSEVVKKLKGKIPGLVIHKPVKDEIEKIQRRRFVRIEVAIDVAVHTKEKLFAPFTTISTDISAGGMSIILPDGMSLSNGEVIEITFVLPMNNGQYHYITTSAEIVVMKMLSERIQTASLKFLHLESNEQQKIIQYCFEKQREERQKELL